MAIAVERDGNRGVPKHLRDDLGVDALEQQQGRRRVPEIVEANAWPPELLRRGRKLSRSKFRTSKSLPMVLGKTRSCSSQAGPSARRSARWREAWRRRASQASGVKAMRRRLRLVLVSAI